MICWFRFGVLVVAGLLVLGLVGVGGYAVCGRFCIMFVWVFICVVY